MLTGSRSGVLQNRGVGAAHRSTNGPLQLPLHKFLPNFCDNARNRTSDLRRGEHAMVASTSGRGSYALEKEAPRGESAASTFRPWQFDLPTLEEMRHDDWPDKVRDWEMFWARHKIWQQFIQYRAMKNAKPQPEHEEWWGLHDLESVTAALKAVGDRIPDILALGVPIPDHIPFDEYNVFVDRRELDIYGKKKINQFSLDPEYHRELNPLVPEESDFDAPAPWEDWTEWDYRAFMEKRRRHEEQYAHFMGRQRAVGQHDHLNISPMNDHRFLTNFIEHTGELPVRSTHEEFMSVITNNGRSVHPGAVSIREQDPLERSDYFQEGVHYVPETEDFLRALGHFQDSDSDLIWRREEAASPTLNEAFADFEDALPTDREGNPFEAAEQTLSGSSGAFEGKDGEDSESAEGTDEAFGN